MTALGLMSGTSMDGMDVGVVETDGESVVRTGAGMTVPYPDKLARELFQLLEKPERAADDGLTDLEQAVTDAHCDAVIGFLQATGIKPADIDVIGFHGQTVLHRPERRFTRQLGLGQRMADRLRLPVVNRFRHADVAAGGEGAPFVPVFHQALAAGLSKPLAILNLGGVGNVTYLSGNGVSAFDTGPAGALIDDTMRRRFGRSFDEGGAVAARGTVNRELVDAFLADPFFTRPPPKSLDRNTFHRWGKPLENLSPEDAVATATAFTLESVAAALNYMPESPNRWLVTGGGRRNDTLLRALGRRLGVNVAGVETVGWNGDFMEAHAFGYLAVRHLRGLPLSFPETTGVPRPMPGGVSYKPR
ncbi:MAG: anhydro-N-acetylmuramic acid kinase [Methylobacteriaceae bacterium]|nr:anhydro-N-acetylmuramic acid kinase [Methylobacteriaceae bacterium]